MTNPAIAAVHSAEGHDFSDFQPVQTVAAISADDFDFFKATEGTGWTGKTFAANWANAKAAGKPRGAYHFLHPGEDAIAQARHSYGTVKAAGIKPGDMFVVDSELPSGVVHAGAVPFHNHLPLTNADVAATPSQVDACTKGFLDELGRLLIADGLFKRVGLLRRKALVNPLITYTMHVIGQGLAETAKAYPLLWFAWPSNTAPPARMYAPWRSWLFWQWGTRNGADADAFNGTVADLKAFIAKYLPPKLVKRHKLLFRTADGTKSLRQIASFYGTSPAWIIAWTFRLVAWASNPGFGAYVLSGRWDAPLPKGTALAIWAWVEVPVPATTKEG